MTGWTVFARLVSAVLAVGACAVVISSRGDLTPIDRALPLIALLLIMASLLTLRFSTMVFLGVPMVIVAAFAIPQERLRLVAYGILVAVALGCALHGMIERGAMRIEFWRAIGFILIMTVLLKAVPFQFEMLWPLFILLVGLAFLTYAVSDSFTSLHVIPIVIAVGLLTPMGPIRVSLFPLILAFMIGFVRTGSMPSLAAGAIVSLAAGRWAILLVVISASAPLVFRWKRSTNFALTLPPVRHTWAALARALIFSPATVADAISSPRGSLISATLLAAVALFLRPALALIYLISAVALLLPAAASQSRQQLALPSGIFAGVWVVLFAWSGILAPAFPLPFSAAPQEVRVQPIGHALAAGESSLLVPVTRSSTIFLVVFGSNVSHLHSQTPVGRVAFVGTSGPGFVRDLTMSDLADWGAFRPAHFFVTRNRQPREARYLVSGYGAEAYAAAFARIELRLDEPIDSIRLTAAPALPSGARLEVRQLEFPRR